jgi:NADPH:quinone reductase-like Zn-dependent oxidoreductase
VTEVLISSIPHLVAWMLQPPTRRHQSILLCASTGASLAAALEGGSVHIKVMMNATTSENSLATKPANLTFEQAAAVPTAALTALQGIRDKGKVRPGQRVLVNGASGGVGSFAVQIAKTLGAEVTGVCSSRNVGMVRAIGADHVVDYTNEDFTRSGNQYDLILDNVANRSFSAYRRALAKRGIVVPNSGHGGMSYVMKAALLSLFMRSVGRPFIAKASHEDFVTLKEMLETGKLKPVIDRTYAFPEIPEAIEYVGTNRARGKVVITMK